jgi:polygalacturonase
MSGVSVCIALALAAHRVRPVTYNITDFGAVADDHMNNHAAIAAAVHECEAHGGCRLVFPRTPNETVYRTSSFNLSSHITLDIPEGVVLRGTETDEENLDESSWPTLPWVEYPSRPCMSCPYPCGGGCGPAKRAWLHLHNVTDVEVTGGGTLHGGGRYWWCNRMDHSATDPGKGRPKLCAKGGKQLENTCPPRMIHVVESTKVLIHDINLMWSPFWTVHVQFW